MKLSQWGVWLLVGWFCCLVGCSPSVKPEVDLPEIFGGMSIKEGRAVLDEFIVEGNAYSYQGVYKQAKDRKLIYSLTLVFPHAQNYYTVARHKGEKIEGQIFTEKIKRYFHADIYIEGRPATGETNDKWVADAPFYYVYFLDNGKIVCQKSYKELGIDVSDPQKAFDKRNLLPILKKLIRANVKQNE